MATYLDLTRTSTQGCAFAFNVHHKFTNPSWAIPPGFYLYTNSVDFTVGGHYGCSARFQVLYQTSGGATVPTPQPWYWSIIVRVTVNNGHGVTTTQDVVIDSGSYIAGVTDYAGKTASISGTFNFSVPTGIYYDITETQPDPSTTTHPPYTTYNQYERSLAGQTATCTAVVNGTTVAATGVVTTPQPTTYSFTFSGTNVCVGSQSLVLDLLVSGCLTNGIAIPSYTYLHYISAALFVSQTSSIELKNTGTDDAFGDPQTTTCTLTSSVALKRQMRALGKINAFDISYPDPLTVVITGFDTTQRTITCTGSFEELHTINNYSFASTLNAGGTPSNQSAAANNIPAYFKTAITAASLTANGDDIKATRLPFRSWPFPGCFMSLADQTEITGGTGNIRNYSPTQNLNGYRYLDLEVKSLTGTNQTSAVTAICQPTSDTKAYTISTSSSTYEYKRIDLLAPTNKTSTIDVQDDPYPRLNPTNPSDYPAQEVVNSDYYGITRLSDIAVGNTNVQLNRLFLRAVPDSALSVFVPSFNYTLANFRKIQTDALISGTTYTYYGRRLWQVSTSGRFEEEPDIIYRTSAGGGTTWYKLTISDFVARVLANQRGWSASASTAAGSGMAAYANSTTGYAVWLGGLTFKADTGGGTVQKDWIYVKQNQGQTDCDVLAQPYFDQINGDMVPDYVDPFGVYKSNTHITLPSAAILRGHAHGVVFDASCTPKNLATVVYSLTSTSASRGTGTTDLIGEYNTGTPKGLPTQGHTVNTAALVSNVTETYTAKRVRRTFRDAVAAGDRVAADVAGDQTVTLGVVTAGVLALWFTLDATPTNWYTVTTSITGIATADIKYSLTDTEQTLYIVVATTSNSIQLYATNNHGGTVTVPITIDAGTNPAIAVAPFGVTYIAYRHTSGALKVAKLDAQGNALGTTTAVASIPDTGCDIWWRLDYLYIAYKDATGIQVITSTDDGATWA